MYVLVAVFVNDSLCAVCGRLGYIVVMLVKYWHRQP